MSGKPSRGLRRSNFRSGGGRGGPGIRLVCLLLVSWVLPVAEALPQAPVPAAAPARPPTSTELLRSGDLSAKAGRHSEALLAWKRAYERRFSAFREVPFVYPVEADFLDRAGLRKQLTEEIEKELPDEKAISERKSRAAFGLCPPEMDLKATMLNLLTEEIGGFYDPDTKRLYLIKEGGEEDKRKWWQKLLGSGGFDPEEQKTILIHEMSHALMDQYHDLLSIQRSGEHDDDMALAIGALIEGEATLCMMVGPASDKDVLRLPPGFMNTYMGLITPFLSFATGPAYRSAPRVIRESLIFPYLSGMAFCLSLTSKEGDWAPVDRAFSEPPLSTEIILHPEKYRIDAPLAVTFPDLSGELGKEWSEVRSNVLGELVIRIRLSEKLPAARSAKAAEGWGGDFYRLYERAAEANGAGSGPKDAGEPVLAWATVWDSRTEAEEFEGALVDCLAAERGQDPGAEELPVLPPGEAARTWRKDSRVAAVFRKEAQVWLLQGVPEAVFPKAAARVMKTERKPKVFQLKKAKPAVEFSAERRLRTGRY